MKEGTREKTLLILEAFECLNDVVDGMEGKRARKKSISNGKQIHSVNRNGLDHCSTIYQQNNHS